MKHELIPSLNRSLSTLGFALLLPGLGFAAVAATGGGESTTSGYQVHTFTATGSNSFSVTESGYVEVLLVGGGGGGGNTIAGGGGGGGFIVTNRFFVEGGSNYTVMVGAGGLGSPTSEGYAPASIGGRRGADSSFATFVAYGGGGGRNYQSLLPDPFVAVGSGGGMGGSASDGPFPGTYGQGHTGGTNSPIDSAGGGGGAGADGKNGLASAGGAGGAGLSSAITGTEKFYAGGGGGGVRNSTVGTGGAGGLGGGGKGHYNAGYAGTVNTGGGGGGGGFQSGAAKAGGNGGSGIVVIRYRLPDSLLIVGSPENYGSPTPPYGLTNGLENGDAFLCSAPTGWVSVTAGTRTACTGYQLFTNEVLADTGPTNEISYTHTSPSTLFWQWHPLQHEITFSASVGGTVSTNGGWYDEGSNVTVTAIVTDPLRHFAYWTGDVPAGMETNLTLSFAADQPRAISAYFGGTFHVSTNGLDVADGLSWATAKLTLEAALADARTDDTVLVSNGVYSITTQISVTNDVTVRSVNGAEHTEIRRTGGAVPLVLLKHADALFDGFSVTKGTHGAVYIDGAGTLENCIISNNVTDRAVTDGAGVYLKSGGVVKNCQIINNQLYITAGSSRHGGGIYMTGGGQVDSCIVSNNMISPGGTGNTFGGGVYMTGATCVLRNSLIAQNWAPKDGGGVYCVGGTIESCTIVDNTTPNVAGAGGIYNSNGTIINTIIAYNNNPNGLSNYKNAGSPTYSTSCTDPAVAGVGNTDLAPQFVDFGAQDYRLLAGPCVNTGLNQDWMTNALDVAGNPRIVSGTVDMGAYELVPGPLRIGFDGTPTGGFASNLVVFTAFASGANTTGLYYAWSFNNDETVDAEGFGRKVVTNLYWPGLYAVRLTVSNAIDEVDTMVREQYIKVAPTTAYVTTNGASIYPYDTWPNAATNIQDALDAGLDGTLVLVSNGVYGITSRIDMPLNITLRSVNGAEKTEIRRIAGAGGILYLTVPEAVVDGFTIANATDTAVYLDRGGGVSNCIIRNNITTGSGGSGGGVRLESGGWLKNCIVINNKRGSSGGGNAYGGGVYMSGASAIIESCIISNNSSGVGIGSGGGVYMTDGTLRNSLISGNRHNTSAGGVYATGGIIESCTIVSNSTPTTAVGGLYSSGITIRNSIIQFNTAQNILSNYVNFGAATYYTCSTYPTNGLTGSYNLDSDPLFKNVASGDCRLSSSSPCINAGSYQSWMEGALDVAGNSRILNKLVDIGAYENRLPGGSLMMVR